MPVHAALLAASLTIFAAADLVPALRPLIQEFERSNQAAITLVPGSTGTLTQQIRNGAPADLFFAANDASIDDLARDALIRPESRTVYARGRLVLVRLKSAPIGSLKDLARADVRRIAIANPAHAPYGLAAQQALQSAGLLPSIKSKLVFGENVQQAVQFVQSGSAEAGLVARSLAGSSDLEWTFVDQKLYSPLNQTAVVLARSQQQELAAAFLNLVRSPRGHSVLQSFGFLIPGKDF